jgi:hypothetical protein
MSGALLAIALAAPEWGRPFIRDNFGGFYRTIDIVPQSHLFLAIAHTPLIPTMTLQCTLPPLQYFLF